MEQSEDFIKKKEKKERNEQDQLSKEMVENGLLVRLIMTNVFALFRRATQWLRELDKESFTEMHMFKMPF